jgi:two-component system, chemotaxis family, CheB/CheR fusion protein
MQLSDHDTRPKSSGTRNRRTAALGVESKGAAARKAGMVAMRAEREHTPRFQIVGIGASAGGLEAFTQLLRQLPSDPGMAFVLVQHLDPSQPSFLREALAKTTGMTVSQPDDGTLVEPNHVYVIPPGADISMRHGLLVLSPRRRERRSPHLPVDFLFASLADEQGSHAIGVVLSGNGSDGTEGLRAIKAEGGMTFAQDPKSAKFDEMPRSAIDAGVVDHALAIPELATELQRSSGHASAASVTSASVAASASSPSADDSTALAQIVVAVREGVGVDFSEYKRPTFKRRLARRMARRRVDGLREYLSLLRVDPKEIHALCEEVLIHVTSFFRDAATFEVLASQIIPAILKGKPAGMPVRFWVAGGSTGEEVYSLAIVLLEALGEASRPVQVFGSDISEATIAKARMGVYPDVALQHVSEERRRRFFVKTEHGYRVSKAVRDVCVFVQHDLGRDPPFAKLDLVSCRNVFIYFHQELQTRIVATFHYALNQPGFLLLGRAETISGFDRLFSAVDKKHRIFARTAAPAELPLTLRRDARPAGRHGVTRDSLARAPQKPDVSRHLDRLLLARYAPSGVVVNEKLEILQFRGQTGRYLEMAPGTPQNNIVKMARPGLLSALRATIAQAQREMASARTSGVEVDHDGSTTTCDIVVVPLAGLPDVEEPLYVVLFEAASLSEPAPAQVPAAHARRLDRPDVDRASLRKVEHELTATKEYLSSLIEEHERATDDLGAANEELVSANEELQSMNEELETAKEELQSTNEELTTVNDELQDRNREAAQVNSDFVNLLATVEIPILIVDLERRIRRFTPKARSILNVLPNDVGRPVDDIKPNIEVQDLDRQIAEVIETMAMKESEVRDHGGRWYRMQIRPYKTTDNRIDGAILSLVDIDTLKHNVGEALQGRVDAEDANRAKDLFLAVLGHELRTPLSSLLLHAQILRRADGMNAARLARVGEAIERAARTQMQLMDDLLDVSRIIAGKLKINPRPVDLGDIVNAAVESVSGAAERKSVAVEVTIEKPIAQVDGDPVRLQQVVSNLLTNAIKFTPPGSRVRVAVATVDGRARLEVRDTGIGIAPEFLPHVFSRFSQQDTSTARRHGGLGLGLAICRHLVEQHGGTIKAESPGTDQGATFTVLLPLLPSSPDSVRTPTVRQAHSNATPRVRHDLRMEGLRILLVDDDLGSRDAVAEMLGDMGADVKVAESAAEAMSTFAKQRPQILLCDIAMPDEDGYSFIRRVRSLGRDAGGDVPAVALTAFASDEDQRRSLAAGFQKHLAKPVEIERLSATVVELAAQA